ncbi:hypothetical protein PanWU01x14_221010, partial [Parasponia andersonii]
MSMMELRKKILTFRDVLHLSPCDDYASIDEVYQLVLLRELLMLMMVLTRLIIVKLF